MKNKKDTEILLEDVDDVEEIEYELDDEIIDGITSNLERVVTEVFEGEKDGRIELIHVLLSVTAQISIDMGMQKEGFLNLCDFIFDESKILIEEEEVEIDISRLN